MSHFLRLLDAPDKESALTELTARLRAGDIDSRIFSVDAEAFDAVPGKPFAYWISEPIRDLFRNLPGFEPLGGTVEVGLQTSDDNRFIRLWSEISEDDGSWCPFSKGGNFSRWYADPYLLVKSENNFDQIVAFQNARYPYLNGNARSFLHADINNFKRSGLTWPLRSRNFAPRILPLNCAFSIRGYAAFPVQGLELATLSLFNSAAFDYLFKVALGRFGFPEFLVGILQRLPWKAPVQDIGDILSLSARKAWLLKRTLDTINETSHAFLLPGDLRVRLGDYNVSDIEAELVRIQAEVDNIAFNLYGFSDADRSAVLGIDDAEAGEDELSDDGEGGENEAADDAPGGEYLLSWAIGVVFGRFDWRLATGERTAPPAPDPFDPLPAKSPGMLPDGAMPFHSHSGILVDDQGHPHDLARLVEQVLETVDASVAEDVRRWLQKDFFVFHLKRYSKSRRKAPIYWPLATASGSYTLWLYYPSLSDQTLFTAVNDFVDPKLEDVRKELQTLRDKGAGRSKQDEKCLEALTSLEHELADLRDSLLEIAPNYRPSHDDGVQITAAPLWKLFRLKPWQKVLKDTWAKLEKGDYDWAHLAMNYWPDRVHDKCVTDKSLAIAHGLEHLYVEPEPVEKKTRGRKKAGSTE